MPAGLTETYQLSDVLKLIATGPGDVILTAQGDKFKETGFIVSDISNPLTPPTSEFVHPMNPREKVALRLLTGENVWSASPEGAILLASGDNLADGFIGDI